jgi:Zn-dependent protease|tara:strand:+ start:110 stop:739 length:630 start_codon:yes stop_codon:yes gene_type:complete
MIISLLFSEPTLFLIWILAITYGITVHEFAHVFAAFLQGDDTGRLMGRLTLNPIAHLDPMGSLLLLVVGFGWGRPAPFNPHNLKYRRWGEFFVSIAGLVANLISIIIFGILGGVLINVLGGSNLLIQFLISLVYINIILLIFNLLPIPPLDGSKILFEILPDKYSHLKSSLEKNGPWILLFLIFSDLILGIDVFGGIRLISTKVIELFF